MRKRSRLLLATLILLIPIFNTSCSIKVAPISTEVTYDQYIDVDLKKSYNEIKEDFFNAIKKEDLKFADNSNIEYEAADEIKQNLGIWHDAFGENFKYMNYHDFQIDLGLATDEECIVPLSEDYDFDLKLPAVSETLFVSYECVSLNEMEFVFGFVFAENADGTISLERVESDLLRYKGYDALDLYEQSLEGTDIFEKFKSICIAVQLCGNSSMKYDSRDEIYNRKANLEKTFHDEYEFPLQLNGGQQFVKYDMKQDIEHGIVPECAYVTDTDITDEGSIKPELKKVASQIKSDIPQLLVDFDYVYMNAYNEMPIDRDQQYQFYGLIVDI